MVGARIPGDIGHHLVAGQDRAARLHQLGHTGTVTGTLDFKPVDGSNNLVIRWDNRIETSNEDIFFNRSSNETNVWFGTVLGVVVTTDT